MKVLIQQPAKTAMQSGRAKTRRWKMLFEESQRAFVEPLMGWVGQRDTTQELSLSFDSEEAAVAFASKHGLAYEVIPPRKRCVKQKSYAENFSFHTIKAF